ncbi:hypothetical protein F4780DRAFT_400610 [Xylariomycetidae sp. FL0641]|nr:hypothetical protein F4780DRAFT_400610 [Xylariomycetidae sp. FL0641]
MGAGGDWSEQRFGWEGRWAIGSGLVQLLRHAQTARRPSRASFKTGLYPKHPPSPRFPSLSNKPPQCSISRFEDPKEATLGKPACLSAVQQPHCNRISQRSHLLVRSALTLTFTLTLILILILCASTRSRIHLLFCAPDSKQHIPYGRTPKRLIIRSTSSIVRSID